MRVCVCVCVCVCVRVSARARARACVCVCVCVSCYLSAVVEILIILSGNVPGIKMDKEK